MRQVGSDNNDSIKINITIDNNAIQQLGTNISPLPGSVYSAKWFYFVMDILWVILIGVFIGEVVGTLVGMYWLSTAPFDAHNETLYDAIKSAMPKGMIVCMFIALFIYFVFRIVALFNFAEVETTNDVFKAKLQMLQNENRWVALENLIRSFVGERIAERSNFVSSDLVKVSCLVWDKVKICNSRMLMLPILTVLIFVSFPIFSGVLHFTLQGITPVVEKLVAGKENSVQVNDARTLVNIFISIVTIIFILICGFIVNKAILNIDIVGVFKSPKVHNDFLKMLFLLVLVVICWPAQIFPFLAEALIVTFMFYATGMFYYESQEYGVKGTTNILMAKIAWGWMLLAGLLAGFIYPPAAFLSIVVIGAVLFGTAFLLTPCKGLHLITSIGCKILAVVCICFVLRRFAPYFLTGTYILLDINVLMMLAACFSVIGIFAIKNRQDDDIVVFDLVDYVSKILLIVKYKNQLELWVDQGIRENEIEITKRPTIKSSQLPRQSQLLTTNK
jgi:hypothetical protein